MRARWKECPRRESAERPDVYRVSGEMVRAARRASGRWGAEMAAVRLGYRRRLSHWRYRVRRSRMVGSVSAWGSSMMMRMRPPLERCRSRRVMMADSTGVRGRRR